MNTVRKKLDGFSHPPLGKIALFVKIRRDKPELTKWIVEDKLKLRGHKYRQTKFRTEEEARALYVELRAEIQRTIDKRVRKGQEQAADAAAEEERGEGGDERRQ